MANHRGLEISKSSKTLSKVSLDANLWACNEHIKPQWETNDEDNPFDEKEDDDQITPQKLPENKNIPSDDRERNNWISTHKVRDDENFLSVDQSSNEKIQLQEILCDKDITHNDQESNDRISSQEVPNSDGGSSAEKEGVERNLPKLSNPTH